MTLRQSLKWTCEKLKSISKKKWGNPDPELMDYLYGGQPHISLLF